jgi:chitin disaccharide deacetylase
LLLLASVTVFAKPKAVNYDMFIVINSDDLGLHPAVRRAVAYLHSIGALGSATIMANGPDFGPASEIRGPGIGVHLNILRGPPLSDVGKIRSLVDDSGLLLGDYTRLFRKYATGRVDRREVRLEWSAQIERVIESGIRPTHLDSEKHIHAWPGLTEIVVELARYYGIAWVRRPIEKLRPGIGPKAALRVMALGLFGLGERKRYAGADRPDAVWGIARQGEALGPEAFAGYLRSLSPAPRVVEIVCHPGMPLPEDGPIDTRFGRLRVAGQWEPEARRLADPGWKSVFAEFGAVSADYGHIACRENR